MDLAATAIRFAACSDTFCFVPFSSTRDVLEQGVVGEGNANVRDTAGSLSDRMNRGDRWS